MVELNRTTFNQPLQRSQGVRARGIGARVPVRVPADPTGAALQSFGQGLGQLGRVQAEIERRRDALDERFRRVQADIQGTEATTTLLDQMQARALEIQADPAILPMDRAQAFDDEFGQAVEQISGTLPEEARAGFLRTTGSARRSLLRDLADQGRKETVARAGAAFEVFKSQITHGLIRADSDVETLQLLSDLEAVGSQYVRNGIFSAEVLSAQVQQAREESSVARMRILIDSDPTQALESLSDAEFLADSGLPGEAIAPLLGEARQRQQSQFLMNQRAEARGEEIRRQQSRTARIQRIEQMVLERDDIAGLQGLLQETRVAREEGRLTPEDAESVQRFGLGLLDDRSEEQRNTTEPVALQQYFRLLLDDPQEAQEFVVDHVGSGLAVGSATGLFNGARSATDERHFRNLRETQDAIAFIEAQLGTTGDPLLDATVSVELGGIRADAITEFLTRMMAVAGDEGLNRDAVLQALPAVRDQVTQTHRARLKAIVEGAPSQVGDPQTQSVGDSVRQWRHMIQSGVPKYEADAFLGRELARHSAMTAEGDRLTNAQGIAAELQQALQQTTQAPAVAREVLP